METNPQNIRKALEFLCADGINDIDPLRQQRGGWKLGIGAQHITLRKKLHCRNFIYQDDPAKPPPPEWPEPVTYEEVTANGYGNHELPRMFESLSYVIPNIPRGKHIRFTTVKPEDIGKLRQERIFHSSGQHFDDLQAIPLLGGQPNEQLAALRQWINPLEMNGIRFSFGKREYDTHVDFKNQWYNVDATITIDRHLLDEKKVMQIGRIADKLGILKDCSYRPRIAMDFRTLWIELGNIPQDKALKIFTNAMQTTKDKLCYLERTQPESGFGSAIEGLCGPDYTDSPQKHDGYPQDEWTVPVKTGVLRLTRVPGYTDPHSRFSNEHYKDPYKVNRTQEHFYITIGGLDHLTNVELIDELIDALGRSQSRRMA